MSATAVNQGTLESFGDEQQLERSVSTVDLLIHAAGMVPLVCLIGLVAMIFTALVHARGAR